MNKKINLQLFADGGGEAAGAESTTQFAEGTQAETVDNGQTEIANQEETIKPGEEQAVKKTFEELIKGEYKEDYKRHMDNAINKRFRSYAKRDEEYKAKDNVLGLIARRYGVDPNNPEAITNAILNDDTYYEKAALENGNSIEAQKQLEKLNMETMTLRQQVEQQRQRDFWNDVERQANEFKANFPVFDFGMEYDNNETFREYINAGVKVKDAFMLVHGDEIRERAIAAAVEKTKENMSKDIAAGARPAENGTSSQAAAVTKTDYSKLKLNDLKKIEKMLDEGKQITL